MRFSVVIPTYNRQEKLKKCLQALFAQDFDKNEFEIIIVDDGSQDTTLKFLKRIQKKSPIKISFFSQTNQGQGVARNKGIDEAFGEIVLLLGDDIIATPTLLQYHDKVHRRHPEENAACLGFITWHPDLGITPLMKFMERGGVIFGKFGGHQFAFDLLKNKSTADYRFFYTSNISLKRSLLFQYKFDPWFAGYGWEDIELGYRLQNQAGMVLYYEPYAKAYHDHTMTFEDFAQRMRNIGKASLMFNKKYPELNKIPSIKKQTVFRILASNPSLLILKTLNKNLYFYALSKKYFLEGLKETKIKL